MRAKHCSQIWKSRRGDTAWNSKAVGGTELRILPLERLGLVLLWSLSSCWARLVNGAPCLLVEPMTRVCLSPTGSGSAAGAKFSAMDLFLWLHIPAVPQRKSAQRAEKELDNQTSLSPGSAEHQTLSTLRAFPGSEVHNTACNFWASIHAKAQLFLEERKHLFVF